ncbi:fimbrial protein [Cronobacter turicensis]|nr:fimbrial protein [Cronobacter turicensis]
MNKCLTALFVLVVIPLLPAKIAMADDNTAQITVTVTINSAPCVINNNQNIDVNFGESVVTTDVMAGTIQKAINYTLDCSNADTAKLLKMHISGTGADFNSSYLQTTIPELAVKLKADGVDFPLNTNLDMVSADAKPQLFAELVSKPGTHLPTGGFTAGATMSVDYE